MTNPSPRPSASAGGLFGNIVKLSTLYSTGLLALRLASLILLPINTRFLTPTDYGVLELLEQLQVVLSHLLGGSFGASLGFFYFEKDTDESRQRVIGTTIIGSIMLGLLAGAAGVGFGGLLSDAAFGNSSYATYVRVAMTSLPCIFVLEAEFSTLRVGNRGGMFAGASVLRVLITIAATLTLVAGLRLRIWGVLFTGIASNGLVAIALAIYQFRKTPPCFDKKLFLRMWRYAAPLGLSSIAMFIIHFGDRFWLPRYRPLAELGIYALAYKLAMMLSLFHGSFHTYWNAQVYAIMKRDDVHSVFGRIFTYMMAVVSLCALGLVVGAKPVFRILTQPAFHSAALIVPLLVGAYYLRAIGDFFRTLFFAADKPSGDAICNGIGAVVCVAGYTTLIPRYGIWGAAAATAVTFAVIAVVSIAWSYRLYKYRLETGRLVRIGLVLAVLCMLYYAVPVSTLALQVGWAVLLVVAFPVLLISSGFSTASEREKAWVFLQGLRNWRKVGAAPAQPHEERT